MTTVMDLRTGKIVGSYSLPPEHAVRNAWLQFERKDFNTWDYDKADVPGVLFGTFTVSCGDYSAFTDPRFNAALNEEM